MLWLQVNELLKLLPSELLPAVTIFVWPLHIIVSSRLWASHPIYFKVVTITGVNVALKGCNLNQVSNLITEECLDYVRPRTVPHLLLIIVICHGALAVWRINIWSRQSEPILIDTYSNTWIKVLIITESIRWHLFGGRLTVRPWKQK